MIITAHEIDLAVLRIGQSSGVRAPGLHASTIYNDFYKEKEPDRYDRGDGPPPPLLLETGLILETALEEGLARKYESSEGAEQITRPGEFTTTDSFDGHPYTISYNPDLFIYNGHLRGGEIKATWLSSKIPHEWLIDEESRRHHQDDINDAFLNPKFDKYYTQMKFYGKLLKCLSWRLYICFIAGDYTRPYKTQLVARDIEFTQDDVDSEYAMLMWHALSKGMLVEGYEHD